MTSRVTIGIEIGNASEKAAAGRGEHHQDFLVV